jgi:hypothetical protein
MAARVSCASDRFNARRRLTSRPCLGVSPAQLGQPPQLEESVLRYRTAGPEAMRGQQRHLLAAPANPRPPKRVKPTVTAPWGVLTSRESD